MEIAVWDTYVRKDNGYLMHFDILVAKNGTSKQEVFSFGEKYLQSKGVYSKSISSKECSFCHVEKAPKPIEDTINAQGYAIIELQNCND